MLKSNPTAPASKVTTKFSITICPIISVRVLPKARRTPNLGNTLAQTALCHTTQVNSRYQQQNDKNNYPLTPGRRQVRFPIGGVSYRLLFLIVRTVTINQLISVFSQQIIILQADFLAFFTNGIEIVTVTCQNSGTHHAHVIVAPRILSQIGRSIRYPYQCISSIRQS